MRRIANTERSHYGLSATVAAVLTLACLLVVAPTAVNAQNSDDDGTGVEFRDLGPKKHQKRQKRPVNMGTSGGNATAFAPGDEPGTIVCSSGTLGGLLLKNGEQYILSNNHVLALENEARKGDPVNQPGLIDNRCRAETEDFIGELAGWKKIKTTGKNKVDAAIAKAYPGMVNPNGKIVGIGIPGNDYVQAEVGMNVKKSGRTSGITKGTVVAVDVTIRLELDEGKFARFVKQIVIEPRKKTFAEGGDSGSIVYLDQKPCPPAVGLLFGGDERGWGVINPMKEVLKAMKKVKPKGPARLVGCDPPVNAAAAAKNPAALRLQRHLRKARRVHRRAGDRLLEHNGVAGSGVGLRPGSGDQVAVHIYVEKKTAEVVESLPAEIDGIPTAIIETGKFKLF